MEAAKIWLTAIIATIAYGIAHDLVTTRVSLEYFTIAHAGIFQTQSPTLLAFGWGIVATWWAGVLLGGMIALTARFGKRPKVALRDLARRRGLHRGRSGSDLARRCVRRRRPAGRRSSEIPRRRLGAYGRIRDRLRRRIPVRRLGLDRPRPLHVSCC